MNSKKLTKVWFSEMSEKLYEKEKRQHLFVPDSFCNCLLMDAVIWNPKQNISCLLFKCIDFRVLPWHFNCYNWAYDGSENMHILMNFIQTVYWGCFLQIIGFPSSNTPATNNSNSARNTKTRNSLETSCNKFISTKFQFRMRRELWTIIPHRTP